MFTDLEWKLVQEAPMLAGAVIPTLDFGVISIVKEGQAILDSMAALRATYAQHDFLREVFGLTEMPQIGKQDDPKGFLVGQVRDAMQVMRMKASSDEVDAYARSILELAERVAGASGSGWFGFGVKISDQERAYLDELKRVVS